MRCRTLPEGESIGLTMTSSTTGTIIRIAVVNDFEIVVAGLAAALEPFHDRVSVVEIDASVPVLSDVDVVLYDTFGGVPGDGVDLDHLVRCGPAKVVVFSWSTDPDLVARTLERGVAGYLSKQLDSRQIVEALERVERGEVVRALGRPEAEAVGASWPGRAEGLTAREAEVVAYIAQGLSNKEIAQRTYLSINSIKTYIRSAYRKMGVESRSQAVIWGLQKGFERHPVRVVDPPGARG